MLTPQLKDKAIKVIVSNLVMAGLLDHQKVGKYMSHISTMTDFELVKQLLGSKRLLDSHYQQLVEAWRN